MTETETGPAVRRETWSGRDVSPREVIEQMDQIRARISHHQHGPAYPEHPHPRNCVLNLVAIAPNEMLAAHAREVAQSLGTRHPARVVVVLPVAEGTGLDAEIRSETRGVAAGSPLQIENVFMRVRGPAVEQLPSLVEPFLVSDVRTHFWWLGNPPRTEVDLHGGVAFADTFIVDSSEFDHPYTSFIEMAALAREICDRVGVGDFHWARLHPWRSAVAQFFGPLDRRHFLEGINGVGIDYIGEARANRSAMLLFTGWLISTLGWKLKRAVGGEGGTVVALFDSPKGPVEVASRSVRVDQFEPGAEFREGEVTAVRIEAAAHGRTCHLVIQRDREHSSRAGMQVEMGADMIESSLPMVSLDEAALLSQILIAGRRDPVFLRSLYAGAETMAALR